MISDIAMIVAVVAGVSLVLAGVIMIYTPAAYIVGGVMSLRLAAGLAKNGVKA